MLSAIQTALINDAHVTDNKEKVNAGHPPKPNQDPLITIAPCHVYCKSKVWSHLRLELDLLGRVLTSSRESFNAMHSMLTTSSSLNLSVHELFHDRCIGFLLAARKVSIPKLEIRSSERVGIKWKKKKKNQIPRRRKLQATFPSIGMSRDCLLWTDRAQTVKHAWTISC